MSLVERLSVLLCEESDEGVESVRMCVQQHVGEFPFSPLKDIVSSFDPLVDVAEEDGTPTKKSRPPRFGSDDTVVVFYSTTGALVGGEATTGASSPMNASSPGRSFYARENVSSLGSLGDGIGRTRLGILTEATREEHDVLLQLDRPMRYVLAFNNKFDGSLGGGDGTETLCLVRHDSQPERVNTSGKRGMAIVTRASAPLQRARDLVASLERGGANIDVDSALTDCCNWLYESIVLIEDEFEHVIAEKETSAFSLVDAVNRKSLSLAMLRDFVTGPSNTFLQLETLVAPTSAVKQRWDQRKSHLTITHSTAKLEARWMQLLSTPLLTLKLTNTVRSQTSGPLLRVVEQVYSALVLIFTAGPSGLESDICTSSPHAAQASRIDGDASSIAARINTLNATSIQASAVIDVQLHAAASSLVRSHLLHFLRTFVIPAIGADLLAKVEELLDLPSSLSIERGHLMPHYSEEEPKASGGEEAKTADPEVSGEGSADASAGGYMVPIATRPAKVQHLKESSALLKYWASCVERLAAFLVPDVTTSQQENLKLLQFDPRRSLALQLNELGVGGGDELEPTTKRWSDLSESVMLSHVRYGAERCLDITKHLAAIEEAGQGNVSPFIRVLYKTLHRASTSFPLLRSAQYRNWQSFVHAFEKCLALKFEVVESVPYPLVTDSVTDSVIGEDDQHSGIGDGSPDGAQQALVDTTAVLRQRVRSAGRRHPGSAKGGGADRATANQSVMSLGSVNVSLISRAEGHHNASSTALVATENQQVANTTNGGGAMEIAMLHEERGILSSRVTVLTEELIECRALLQAMEVQLTKSQRSMSASEELNLVLMSELRALKASQYDKRAIMPPAPGVEVVRSEPHPAIIQPLLAPCSHLLDDVEDDDDTDSSVSSADTYTSSDDDLKEDLAVVLQKYPPLRAPEEGEEIKLREQVAVRTHEREMKRRDRLATVEASVLARMQKRHLKRRTNIQKRKLGRMVSATKQRRKMEKREEKRRIVIARAYERKIRQTFAIMERVVYHSPAVVEMTPPPAVSPAKTEVSPARSDSQEQQRPGSPIDEEQRHMEREHLIQEMVAQSLATADQREKKREEAAKESL